MCKAQVSEGCCTLLKNIYTDYKGNNEHVECLHEMFVAFTADHRREEETHQKVIHTYTQLRTLLKESSGIFESGMCDSCPNK